MYPVLTNPSANRVDGRVLGYSGGVPAWVTPPTQAGIVDVDTFAGANDAAKMSAAFTYAAAQTRVPAIRLRHGVTDTGSTPYGMFTGLKLVGAGYTGGAWGEEISSGKSVVSKWVTSAGTAGSSLLQSTAACYYVTVAGITFHGGATTQIFRSTSNVYGAKFDTLGFYGCQYGFGTPAEKFLMTATEMTGHWTVLAPAGEQFVLGGSDNTLWTSGFINIGGNPSTAGAGKYLITLDGLSKTNVGQIYATGNNGWRPLLIKGNSTAVMLNGGWYEGQNDSDPNVGNAIRVEGTSTVIARNLFLAYSMTSPAGTEHGVVEVAGSATCQVILDGFVYRRDNDVAETVPVAYVSGGSLRVLNAMADKQYNAWTDLPRVQNSGATLNASDGTWTAV